MAKSRKTGSHNFFKITVLGSLLLGLIVVTGAVMMPTNTRSNAAAADNIFPPTSPIQAEIRYDSNGDGKYQRSDDCPAANKFTFQINYDNKPRDGYEGNTKNNQSCVTQIPSLNPSQEHKYSLALQGSDKLSYMYVVYKIGENTTITKVANPSHAWPIDAGPKKFVKIVYGLKNTTSSKNANNPAPKNPDQSDTSSSCGAPKIDYNWSKGHSKSVTYRFTVKNNCSKKQTYRVWANVNENGTSGWSWKFATGASNKSVQKVLSAGESSGSEVTVYRADNTPKGTYKVTFYAAPCDNANNCNSNSDTNDHKQAKYTTSYKVE